MDGEGHYYMVSFCNSETLALAGWFRDGQERTPSGGAMSSAIH